MRWISTTIRKTHMDKIREGRKGIEKKIMSKYWIKRLEPLIKYMMDGGLVGINFLCGRNFYKYYVNLIEPRHLNILVKIDKKTSSSYYNIYLGDPIKDNG